MNFPDGSGFAANTAGSGSMSTTIPQNRNELLCVSRISPPDVPTAISDGPTYDAISPNWYLQVPGR